MDKTELDEGLKAYAAHLRGIAKAFNEYAKERGVPVEMDPERAIEAAEKGTTLAAVKYRSRADDTGIVHEAQLRTAIKCIDKLLREEKRCGHVVGAMQSGKTTTSLALQWAGLVLYLLTGKRVYPFYLIGNQTNHEDQTQTELDSFLLYYGLVEIRLRDGAHAVKPGLLLDAVFQHSPNLTNYRGHVLRDSLQDILAVPRLEDIYRRVGGEQSLQKIAALYEHATGAGYHPLMIIDEPQFGASDRMETQGEGSERQTVQKKCVLAQIFDRIEGTLGTTRDDHWFVGLSATPFELNDLERVWEVRQDLTTAYSGFNFFNSADIDENVEVTPPETMGLTDFADQIGVPFIAFVSMTAYDGTKKTFDSHAKKIGFTGDQKTYQGEVVTALRSAVYELLDRYAKESDAPVGLCIRAFNNNLKTQALMGRLALDPNRIEVLEYFDTQATGLSVKRAIARRKHPKLPYLVLVTNRARMADAFPRQVRFFMDLAQKASDLNALLQGLLGRACGYGKQSLVVLSDANAAIVDLYIATHGGYVHRTSRHSIAVGGFRRGAPTGMIKLRSDMNDPLVRQFFQRIDKEVVKQNVKDGSTKLSVPRSRPTQGTDGYRTGPILLIAEELKLFDHIEQPAVRAELFPQIPTGFHVARPKNTVRHARQPGVMLSYKLDAQGNCRYTFRWSDREAAAQGGAAGRAKGKKDVGQHMEPTVYVEKYDPATGEILDKDKQPDAPGDWRAFMVTFPLREPVQEVKAAEVAYPIDRSPYSDWMTDEERALRDQPQPHP